MDTTAVSEFSAEEWEKIFAEFTRIKDIHYLDHAGTTLYSEKQMENVCHDLSGNLFCNPHTSKTTEDLIHQVRYRILTHFNTDSSEYHVVFTSGATASLKTVAECFKFEGNSCMGKTGDFVYLKDNHTSVLGMREIIQTKNIYSIEREKLLEVITNSNNTENDVNRNDNESNSLIVFPAQCNFNGYKYPLELIDKFHNNQLSRNNYNTATKWFVCLDAASFVATNSLDLNKYKPDFVSLSFYKIFGYPTGLGALLINIRAENVLIKKYYGGGTVKIAVSEINWHEKRDDLQERFEDGTISFLSIISLIHGFNTLERLVPMKLGKSTMDRISNHTFQMGKYLYEKLMQLKYKNGTSVVKFYNDTAFGDCKTQGGIVNFNILRNDGSFVGFAEFACMATIHNIYLRTGCFCNLGACQRNLGLTMDDLRNNFIAGHICGDSNDLINGIPTGSVRVSMGYMTTKSNLDALIKMIIDCYLTDSIKSIEKFKIKDLYKIFPTQANLQKEKNSSISVKLKTICVFPIKSCGAFKVRSKWPLTTKGLKYDREWMIVNAMGVSITQKTTTRLCLIRPFIDEEENVLRLNFPLMLPAEIPLSSKEENEDVRRQTSLCQSKVCGDKIKGIDCGDAIAQWLEKALGQSGLRLIRQSEHDKRFFQNGRQNNAAAYEISLSNQAQFLLINETSVRWLAAKVEDWSTCDINGGFLDSVVDRFRGNLIIETGTELEESEWKQIEIGANVFQTEGACTRCQMICIDQGLGEKTTEPLRTIAKLFQGKMKFGVYLSQADNKQIDNKFISCNDPIRIILA